MNYISVETAAEKWKVTRRQVQLLCARGKVDGAVMISKVWLIPADAVKPPDGRRKPNHSEDKTNGTDSKHKY